MLSLIGQENELALLSVLATVRTGYGVGLSMLSLSSSQDTWAPVSLGGSNSCLKPESTHLEKASVSAQAFFALPAWVGNLCWIPWAARAVWHQGQQAEPTVTLSPAVWQG